MALRFIRRTDGLVYDFDRETESCIGHPSYRRSDPDLILRRLPEFGWCVVDPAGRVSSRPFDDPGVGTLPPTGTWVSRKGDRCYVYDLQGDPG